MFSRLECAVPPSILFCVRLYIIFLSNDLHIIIIIIALNLLNKKQFFFCLYVIHTSISICIFCKFFGLSNKITKKNRKRHHRMEITKFVLYLLLPTQYDIAYQNGYTHRYNCIYIHVYKYHYTYLYRKL